jgi:hypothetical protein
MLDVHTVLLSYLLLSLCPLPHALKEGFVLVCDGFGLDDEAYGLGDGRSNQYLVLVDHRP